MAIYSCNISTIIHVAGQSAIASAAHQSDINILSATYIANKSYGQEERIYHTEIVSTDSAPNWV